MNSSKILPFSSFDARRYRHRTASVYSRMLLRVMLPPFGNTFSEATIPLSVTSIINQFGVLTKIISCAILVYCYGNIADEKIVRKPGNVFINPDALHEARVEALRARKPLGQWLEEAIDEKIEREQKIK